MIILERGTVMEGYDTNGAAVYNRQGIALKTGELQTLMCTICRFLLREAIQVTQCGHRFCKACIGQLMDKGNSNHKCPVDDEEFEKSEVRRDKGCQKEIDSLQVDCPTKPNPCTWRGPLIQIEVHRLECPNTLVSCILKCGLDLRRSELDSHLNGQCHKRLVSCPHCSENIPWDILENHFGLCPEYPAVCDHCQLELQSRKLMKSHLENDCTNYQMACPMGCSHFKGKRSSLIEHVKSHSLDIVQLLLATVSRVELLDTKQQESSRTITSLTEKLEKVTTDCSGKEKRIAELEKELSRFARTEGSQDSLHAVVKSGEYEIPNKLKQPRPASLLPANTVDTLKSGLQGLGPSGAFSHETNFLEPAKADTRVSQMKQEIESHDSQILKMSESVQTMQSHLTQYAVAIDEVRLRQDVLDVKTTHGILVWKIPDVRRRYRDAVDRRTISLYSPPFYTSPHGYRMCIRTYLNGDGIGKGTHLSMFFVVMRSEHDNLLNWPFKQSVRFTLINQKNPGGSITEAFVPDLKSPSFQKPDNDMNIASGFPKFARQSILQDENFTVGNVIYIKCQVDLTGLTSE